MENNEQQQQEQIGNGNDLPEKPPVVIDAAIGQPISASTYPPAGEPVMLPPSS